MDNEFFGFDNALLSRKKAVAYYRHSAEDKQENSIAIQREQLQKFAKDNNIEIIHEEADEGKSGLNSDRPAFQRLFKQWIQNNAAPQFYYVIALDVSRWGRLQDQNEAGYLEYLCTLAGKKVIYASHGLINDQASFTRQLITSIERHMAGEYSRQLSDKTFRGCIFTSQQGYSAGGVAPYGMQRLLLDVKRNPVRLLLAGEQKQVANERVIFIPANDSTCETVKYIFQAFTKLNFKPSEISRKLNENGTLTAKGKKWSTGKIIHILRNETYTGKRIYNKTSAKLKSKRKPNPRDQWVVRENAFSPIVSQEIFLKAQLMLNTLFYRSSRSKLMARVGFQHLVGKILSLNNFEVNDTHLIKKNLSIAVSYSVKYEGKNQWCFIIPENHGHTCFCIGLSAVERHAGVVIFAVDNKILKISQRIMLITEETEQYQGLFCDKQKLEKLVVGNGNLILDNLKHPRQIPQIRLRVAFT